MSFSSPSLSVFTGIFVSHLLEVEPVEAGPSHGTYIIPIADITIETSSGAALDADRYKPAPDSSSSVTVFM